MLKCNFKEISILNMLLNQDFIEAETIMQVFQVSQRTVQSDISMINRLLKAEGKESVEIAIQRGKGYYLNYPFEEIGWIEMLKIQCYDYLNLSMNVRFSDCERVPHIIRLLFYSQEGMKAMELAEILNISIATLNNDMRTVHKLLLEYGLKILSVPYHGMIIKGQELAIRSCMIDFCDIYTLADSNIFAQYCFDEYQVAYDDLSECKKKLSKILSEGSYNVTDRGFIRILYYLMLISLRNQTAYACKEGKTEIIRQLPEYRISMQLLGNGVRETEYYYLAIFILGNKDLFEHPDMSGYEKIVPESIGYYHQVMHKLKQGISFDISNRSKMDEQLRNFFYKWHLRKIFGIREMEIPNSMKKIISEMPSSNALAIYIYQELQDIKDSDFLDVLFYELILTIYNFVYALKNEYKPTNILLVNELGKISNETIINRIISPQYNHNMIFHFCYLYELENLDFSRYDYMFLAEGINHNMASIPIPIYRYDFYFRGISDFWINVLAKKRKIGAISHYLLNSTTIELNCSFTGLVKEVVRIFKENACPVFKNDDEKSYSLIRNAIFHSDYVSNSNIKYINIFTTGPSGKYYIFNLVNTLFINGKKVKSLHFIVLDLTKGIIEIKNGDSEIRHYVEGDL